MLGSSLCIIVLRFCLVFLCAKMVKSSAYWSVINLGSGGVGMSLVYKMYNVGDKGDPCGTPASEVNWVEIEIL